MGRPAMTGRCPSAQARRGGPVGGSLFAVVLLMHVLAMHALAETPLSARLRREAGAFPGLLGLAAKNLATGETVELNGDVRFPTASLIKVALMVEVHHRFADGSLRKEQLVTLREADKAGDEPVVLNQLHDGLALTVNDLVALMIAFSDNTATNLLVALTGAAHVNSRMESHGLMSTKLFRPTFRDGHADVLPELEREFGLGMTTPRDMTRLFELLAEGRVVSRAASDEMLAVMERQFDRQMIPRSLPFERDSITVANKTGWDAEKLPDARGVKGEIRTDAAYVKSAKARFVIAICTRKGRDKRPGADNAALTTGARLARSVYDAWSRIEMPK
jgi:beta-lactamase class A